MIRTRLDELLPTWARLELHQSDDLTGSWAWVLVDAATGTPVLHFRCLPTPAEIGDFVTVAHDERRRILGGRS